MALPIPVRPHTIAFALLAYVLIYLSSAPVRAAGADPTADGYAVVVSKATYADADWKPVADELVTKHGGTLYVYDNSVADVLAPLRASFPRYTCFVSTPAEASRQFVADVHRLVRRFDDDPYADTIWGILTGYDAANALRIARHREPLTVRKVAGGTEVALEMCDEGVWYCELVEGKSVHKLKGETTPTITTAGTSDSTRALVESLNDYKADLFVTSGHATERDWQIGFRYKNGTFQSKAGELFGVDLRGQRLPVESSNPKVYLPIGNCLMGHIDGPDAMALAWMNSAGVNQMIGYTVPTWFGYAGWGCLDYFVEQPGRYTFAEAFAANQHALIHRLTTHFPDLAKTDPSPGEMPRRGRRQQPPASDDAARDGVSPADGVGLLFDRDVVAFYGDPAWQARMADATCAYDQTLTVDANGLHTLTITPRRGDRSFAPVNTNGAQRGWRPIVQFLPRRVRDVEIIEGHDLRPVVTDDFILVPNPKVCEEGRTYPVTFRVTIDDSGQDSASEKP